MLNLKLFVGLGVVARVRVRVIVYYIIIYPHYKSARQVRYYLYMPLNPPVIVPI